jgi:hypothetical protein
VRSCGDAPTTPGTSVRITAKSSQVSVGCDPAPPRAPPLCDDPEETVSMFVPIDAKVLATRAFAPSPIETIAMTAATPMITPSTVSSERVLLRARAARATCRVRHRLMMPAPRTVGRPPVPACGPPR